MSEKEFLNYLEQIGIYPTLEQLDQLKKYYELLIEYNKVMNLTGITEKEDVYLKHFYDSATLQMIVDLNQEKTLCDVGTGAGFPGLVLKILFPNLNVTLVDSLNKRIQFLNTVINELKLTNIKTVHARAEEFTLLNREKFDIVTARAVASLPLLLEYCVPMVAIEKYFIPMKANLKDELELSKNAMNILNINLIAEKEFLLPKENSHRCLLKFKKEGKTSSKYPRKFSEMKKKSL